MASFLYTYFKNSIAKDRNITSKEREDVRLELRKMSDWKKVHKDEMDSEGKAKIGSLPPAELALEYFMKQYGELDEKSHSVAVKKMWDIAGEESLKASFSGALREMGNLK